MRTTLTKRLQISLSDIINGILCVSATHQLSCGFLRPMFWSTVTGRPQPVDSLWMVHHRMRWEAPWQNVNNCRDGCMRTRCSISQQDPARTLTTSRRICKLFGINVLKAGFVFMQMFSELDPTFLSFGKEFPCGQQLGITSYAEVMVKLWYLRTSVCDYSVYGGRWTFLNI